MNGAKKRVRVKGLRAPRFLATIDAETP